MSEIRGCAISLLAVGFAFVVAACESTQTREVKAEGYKFVNDTSELVQTPDEEGLIVYERAEDYDLSRYRKFIIDPVKVVYNDPDMKNLDEEKLKEIQEYFVEAIAKQLNEGGYEVVTAPSEGTMRVEIAIVDLRVPSAAYNAIMVVGSPIAATTGSITIEAAFRDAPSNRLDAVVVARRSGDSMSATPWSNWADVQDSVDAWAEDLREALDAAHEKAAAG